MLRHELLLAARSLTGARVWPARLYGVGPVTALAMTCWLGGAGRFSSSRKAVRFAGLDVTVWSSDRKGPPGRLSRQGPEVLRWAVYEAGKTHARASAPDHRYSDAQAQGPQGRCRCAALPRPAGSSAQACHILTELGDDALTAAAELGNPSPMVAHPDRPAGEASRSRTHPMGHNRGPAPASPLSAATGPAAQGQADGLYRLSARIPPAGGRTPNRSSCRRARHAPAGLGSPGCPSPPPVPSPSWNRSPPVPARKAPRKQSRNRRSLRRFAPWPAARRSAPGRPCQGRLRRRSAGQSREVRRLMVMSRASA